MKKQIVVQNSNASTNPRKLKNADREERLRQELRDNLKKRKAQARAKSEADKNGQN